MLRGIEKIIRGKKRGDFLTQKEVKEENERPEL